MKSLIFAFASILLLQYVSARAIDDETGVSAKTCDDILSTQTCDKLRNIAKIFHEKAELVNEAVRAAVAKHLSNAQDIYKFVTKYLVEKATNFKCEDVLSAEQCSQLIAFAQRFKVSAAELTEDIKEAVAAGVVKASDLYTKTKEILVEKLNNLSCEQVLGADSCNKLRNLAKIFHEKSEIVNEAVKAALVKHLNNAQDIYVFVKNYMIEKATNFKCEDVLSADQCKQLFDLAAKFKVSVANMTEDIKEAVAAGILKGTDLYRKTKEIFLEKLENLSCEQLMDADTCQKIEDFAKKIHASKEELKAALIDAYSKGLIKSKDFLEDAKNFLKEQLSCDRILGSDNCSYLKNLIQRVGGSFDKLMEVLKQKYTDGKDSVTDLYKAAMAYIKDQFPWWPFGFNALSDDDFETLMDMAEMN